MGDVDFKLAVSHKLKELLDGYTTIEDRVLTHKVYCRGGKEFPQAKSVRLTRERVSRQKLEEGNVYTAAAGIQGTDGKFKVHLVATNEEEYEDNVWAGLVFLARLHCTGCEKEGCKLGRPEQM